MGVQRVLPFRGMPCVFHVCQRSKKYAPTFGTRRGRALILYPFARFSFLSFHHSFFHSLFFLCVAISFALLVCFFPFACFLCLPFLFVPFFLVRCFPCLVFLCFALISIIYNNNNNKQHFVCVCAHIRTRARIHAHTRSTAKQSTKRGDQKGRPLHVILSNLKPIKYKSRSDLFSKRLPQ